MQLNFYENQSLGRREEQQDAIGNLNIDTTNGFRLHILADGMGGHTSGSTASSMVVRAFSLYFEQKGIQSPERDLQDALRYANDCVNQALSKNPDLRGMGTTVIALIYNEKSNQYSFISVGDSPLYIFGQYGLTRINANHAYYNKLLKMVEAGVITQQDADNDPQRHAITSAVMGTTIPEIDIQTGVLKEGEILIMASDGIQTLNDSQHGELAEVIARHADNVTEVVHALLDEVANKNYEYQDNTSIVAIRPNIETVTNDTNDDTGDLQPIATPATMVMNDHSPTPKKDSKSSGDLAKNMILVTVAFLAIAAVASALFYNKNSSDLTKKTDDKQVQLDAKPQEVVNQANSSPAPGQQEAVNQANTDSKPEQEDGFFASVSNFFQSIFGSDQAASNTQVVNNNTQANKDQKSDAKPSSDGVDQKKPDPETLANTDQNSATNQQSDNRDKAQDQKRVNEQKPDGESSKADQPRDNKGQ